MHVVPFPDKRTPGQDRPDDEPPSYPACPLNEALERVYDTDAHLALYTFPSRSGWPRVNKPLLSALRAQGLTPVIAVTVLDWDNEGHAPLSPDAYQAAVGIAKSANPPPSFVYKTTNGYRAGFRHPPLEPEDAEALHRGLVEHFRRQGIHYDPTVWQWNRLFRLPNVVRDGQRTESFLELDGPDLDPTTIKREAARRRDINPDILRQARPLAEAALALCWTNNKPTDFMREALGIVKHRDPGVGARLESFLKLEPLPIPTPRNENMIRMAGSIVQGLWTLPGFSPAVVYGMLLPAVNITPPALGRDLRSELWGEILRTWGYEEVKRLNDEEDRGNKLDRMLDAMRAWPDPAPVPDEDRLEWLRRHAVVSVRNNYYVLNEQGWYAPTPHIREHLWSALRDSNLSDIVPLWDEDKPVTPQQILNNYHTPLAETEIQFAKRGQVGWFSGNTFRRCPYFRRADIEPTFNSDAAGWMQAMFGRHYDLACRWCALALAFERGPICILSIKGPDGIGKGMLVQGLAESIDTLACATGEALASWNYEQDRTPFINVNESWPENVPGLADTIRQSIGGCNQQIKKKFLAPERARFNPRVILTANDRSVVQKLFAAKHLDMDSPNAMFKRLTHIELDDGGRRWLEARGNRAFTNGWIADAGTPSRWVLAKHFLWLYEKYGQAGGANRFLMDGRTEPALLAQISMGHGLDIEVAWTINLVLNAKAKEIEANGEIWLTADECVGAYHSKACKPYNGGAVWFGRRMEKFSTASARGKRKIDLEKIAILAEANNFEKSWATSLTSV